MSKHRFCFFGSPSPDPTLWKIDSRERKHIERVLRLKTGDPVSCLDESLFLHIEGLIFSINENEILVRVEKTIPSFMAPYKTILLASALDHGEIEKIIPPLVEIGLSELVVFLEPGLEKSRISSDKLERWNSIEKDARKQCKRIQPMKLHQIKDIKSYFANNLSLQEFKSKTLYLGPNEVPNQEVGPSSEKVQVGSSQIACIGSEKGLTGNTIDYLLIDQKFSVSSLGPHTLRATTAAALAAHRLTQNFLEPT